MDFISNLKRVRRLHFVERLIFATIFALAPLTAVAGTEDTLMCLRASLGAYSDPVLRDIIDSSGRSVNLGFKRGKPFVYNRGLLGPLLNFGREFTSVLDRLTDQDVILEPGSGDAGFSDFLFFEVGLDAPEPSYLSLIHFAESYSLRPANRLPTYVGVTYELIEVELADFDERRETGRFDLITGRYFENIPDAELHKGKRIKVIYDRYGVLSYSEHIDQVMARYLQLLDRDGTLFILGLPDMTIAGQDSFVSWLRSIRGIKVTEGFLNASGERHNQGFVVRITGDRVEIPKLVYLSSDADKPPIRHYAPSATSLVVIKP